MNFRQEKRLFHNWLKRRNLIEVYNEGMKVSPLMDTIRSGYHLLLRSFYWDSTTQGYEFWARLHAQWMRYLNKKRNKY
jgi:hypothetical protein